MRIGPFHISMAASPSRSAAPVASLESAKPTAALEERSYPVEPSEYYTYLSRLSPMLVRSLLWSGMQANFYATYDLFSLMMDTAPRLLINQHQLREDANEELYGGWPMILSGLKPLLETGETLPTPGSLRYATAPTGDAPA